jgi:hypothetical protein
MLLRNSCSCRSLAKRCGVAHGGWVAVTQPVSRIIKPMTGKHRQFFCALQFRFTASSSRMKGTFRKPYRCPIVWCNGYPPHSHECLG